MQTGEVKPLSAQPNFVTTVYASMCEKEVKLAHLLWQLLLETRLSQINQKMDVTRLVDSGVLWTVLSTVKNKLLRCVLITVQAMQTRTIIDRI